MTAEKSRSLINTAVVIAFLTILGALLFEYLGGYKPCELCLKQRAPYYYGIPFMIFILMAWNRFSPTLRQILILGAAGIFALGAAMGFFHSGVEWGFWPGPSSCTGGGALELSIDLLGDSLNEEQVVMCDEVQWRFAGISFAGFNGLIASFIAITLIKAGLKK